MENQHEQEVFEYLTQPEHFEMAAKIHNTMPEIRRQLLTDFWYPVGKMIHDELEKEGWRIVWSEDIIAPYSGFYLLCDGWKGAHVGVEHLAAQFYFGISFPGRTENFDRTAMNQYFSDNRLSFKKSGPYWLAFKHYGPDFSNIADCVNILPTNRDRFATKLSTEIVSYCRTMRPHLEKLNTMRLATTA